MLIAVTPFLTIPIPGIGRVGLITPANAGFGDCADAVQEGMEIVQKVASLAGDTDFLNCAGKVASFDPLSMGVSVFFVGMAAGALGSEFDFSSSDSCMQMVKDKVTGLIVDAIKAVVYEFPVVGQVLDAGFHLVGSSLTDFMNYAGDQLYEMLSTTFSVVFDYIKCGCKMVGTAIELAGDSIKLADSSLQCAQTFGAGIQAVGEYVQCKLAGHCLVPGVQQDQMLNSASYSYPACTPGWLIGSFQHVHYENEDEGVVDQTYWASSGSCTCPEGTAWKNKAGGQLPVGETKYKMSPKVSDYSYGACKCLDPKLGYQAGGVCAMCSTTGPIGADGTCPGCNFGEVSDKGVCKKCGDEEYIEGGVCKRWSSFCPDGFVKAIIASTDPYAPGTQTCEQRFCPDGSIWDKNTKSCHQCKADEMALYTSWTVIDGHGAKGQTTGTCEKCSGNLHSPPGSMMCCPSGQVSNGEECVATKKPGNTKGGGINVKLDVSNPKILDETKPTNDRLIGMPTDNKKKKRGKGSLCPDGQTLTTNAGCQPIKGQPRAPDIALPSERVGSDPSRVFRATTTPGPAAPPLTGYTPGVVTTTPGGTRTPPPPAPPNTFIQGVTKGGGGGGVHTAPPPPPAPPLTTYSPGVMGPGGARTMPPPTGGKP